MLRLDPPLPVVTPQGKGLAHVLIDCCAPSEIMLLL
jgi:hypothetical protein